MGQPPPVRGAGVSGGLGEGARALECSGPRSESSRGADQQWPGVAQADRLPVALVDALRTGCRVHPRAVPAHRRWNVLGADPVGESWGSTADTPL